MNSKHTTNRATRWFSAHSRRSRRFASVALIALMLLAVASPVRADSELVWRYQGGGPSEREYHAMASLGGDQVLLFGGWDASGYNGETWVYDLSDNTWTDKAPSSGPSARRVHAMASLGGDQVLLFGGWDFFFDAQTWVFFTRYRTYLPVVVK